MQVPFSPPFISDEVISEVIDTLKSGWITTGPKTKQFENDIAKYVGCSNCHCVNSATSGLLLSLKLLGIGKGDEVIVPAYTYCVTALVVSHCGAKPIMVDTNQDDFNINVKEIAKAVTPRTKAIIPVDVGGIPCNYVDIFNVLDEKKELFKPSNKYQEALGRIAIIGDSAHSLGAKYNDKMIGSIADVTVFSFHAVKNLTTAEGGAICLNLPADLSQTAYNELKLTSLNGQTKSAIEKSKGSQWRYDIVLPGFKANMPDLCAAMGLVQLRNYDSILEKRASVFEKYNTNFSEYEWAILPPNKNTLSTTSYHLYQLRLKGFTEEMRDLVMQLLSESGVSANVHFIPLPLLSVFKKEFSIDDFPNAYDNYQNEISLPIYPQLEEGQQNFVISSVILAVQKVING